MWGSNLGKGGEGRWRESEVGFRDCTETCLPTVYHSLIISSFSQGPSLDDAALRKMILNFEKKVFRNQEMRIKFADQPEK